MAWVNRINLNILAPALQSVIKGADAKSELKQATRDIQRALSR